MLRSSRFSSNAVRPVKQMSGGCMMLFGLPFLLGGLAAGFFMYAPPLAQWWATRGWEEVPCWVEHAEMKTSHGSKGSTHYSAEARYRYQYRGRTYHGEDVGLMGGSDIQQQAHARHQALVRNKRAFRCYVNADKPAQAVLYHDLNWGMLLMYSLFPTLFPLAGMTVIASGAMQAREAATGRRLVAKHPGEPWRWQREWAGEVIQPQRGHGALLLAIGGWILLVQVPLALAILSSGEIMRTPMATLGLLPALLAAIPLFFAWRNAQARRELGGPTLWLRRMPASPGTVLEGELRFERVLPSLLSLNVRLLCQRHITRRNGDSRSTAKETIWEHRETLPAAEARREATGCALPLRMSMPAGLPCSVVEDAAFVTDDDEKQVWTLEVTPAGTRRTVILPLPVFQTAAAASEAALAEADTHYDVEAFAPDTHQIEERLRARGIRLEFDADGIPTLIDCPPGRFRALGVFLLLFGAIWGGAFVFMFAASAPFIFQLIWGVSSPLILASGVWTLLHHRRVEIAVDEMRVRDSAGPFYSKRQSFAPRHFVGFSHDSNMQSGNQFFYRVRGETTFGKKVTVVDGITESVTAEALAGRLERWRSRGEKGVEPWSDGD